MIERNKILAVFLPLLAAFCLLPAVSWSDEIEDGHESRVKDPRPATLDPERATLTSQLLVIQARMDAERARYEAARAQIDRAAAVFRELKRAEKELKEKIQKEAGRKQEAERQPAR